MWSCRLRNGRTLELAIKGAREGGRETGTGGVVV